MENTYILNTGDYSFSKYADGGFSGKILLATPRKDALPKLLIKSANPYSACNEFMYSRIAELLGIPAPKSYIMDVAERDAKHFRSPYVVGIEFMEGMHRFSLDEMRGSPLWRKEYAEQYALAAMFDQDDRVQLTMRADGHISGYDFTETFWISTLGKSVLEFPDDVLSDILADRIKAMLRRGFSMLKAGAAVVRMHLDLPEDAPVPPDYLAPMERFLNVTETQIQELAIVLDEIYPISISVYFEEYLSCLKKKIEAYLHSVA